MIQLREHTKTVICIGTGGVGKTTFSAMLAIGKAYEGHRVLVLTIDPSLRLAQALGIKIDGDLHPVELDPHLNKKKGSLEACVLNHQKIFKDFILKQSDGKLQPSDVDKILNNKLYQQLSTQLAGSQEFTSLYQLDQFVKSGRYDLVILDTPPAQHTWQFLQAPEKLAQLFNEGIAQWFRTDATSELSLLKKILNAGTTQVLKALEMLTGSEFIKELGSFFSAIQKWQKPLEQKVIDCHNLMVSKNTEFILVTALDPARILESQKLSTQILKEGYQLTTLVINRVEDWYLTNTQFKSKVLKSYSDYYSKIEKNLVDICKDLKIQRLSIYKVPELSQNDLHVEKFYQSYKQTYTV